MSDPDQKNEKLSLGATIGNAWYAMRLAAQISPGMIVHSFFLWLFGYGEWVFFDGIFMRVVVNALDQELGFEHFPIIEQRGNIVGHLHRRN